MNSSRVGTLKKLTHTPYNQYGITFGILQVSDDLVVVLINVMDRNVNKALLPFLKTKIMSLLFVQFSIYLSLILSKILKKYEISFSKTLQSISANFFRVILLKELL